MSHQSIPLPPEPAVANDENDAVPSRRPLPAFVGGALIGMLGGLIGLGGAEFRLPLLIGPFRFRALEAVILNKAMSLVVVASALPFRAATVPFDAIAANWPIILNLLAGSLIGAWFGAGWATRLSSRTLYRVLAALLVLIAVALLFGHGSTAASALLSGPWLIVAGVVAGFAIGVVASLMGVAGGELLIPTLVLLFGADIKLAGSLSLAVSLPTMVVAFTRYSRDSAFATVVRNRAFVAVMAVGSIVGTFIGGGLLGLVPDHVLLPILALILGVSSVKVWRHR
ncbi:sulfite exporter TauE/SafE family protein [Xanthobacter sp. YC-JY1]|uniref:sulfite exporter TauE/SafE family protein n=1 Tax=Xanthobacter sp. YC-JY1 TaxID=2419844 RepID=UPI001F46EA38|nr:sulfite exporter TauE/SafE family protein [Xanthobacter sp. YC-JY1]